MDPEPLGIMALPLIDHHCHGVVRSQLDRPGFEGFINEGFEPAPPGTTHFDAPIGLAVRRSCAPLLDLEPLATPEAYIRRRSELPAEEVNRRLLRGAGLEALLIDSGYRSAELLDLPAMATAANARAHEIVRIEAVAEEVAASGPAATNYPDAFRQRLEERAADAVGLKSIVAYRGGFGFDPSPPALADVARAAGAWFGQHQPDTPWRLTDPVLLRHGLWSGAELARDRGLPIQFHSGWGDPDLTLHLANPSLLTDLVKSFARLPVDVVFLHCFPYHREAAYLAAVFGNVYFDVGSALNYLGPSSGSLMAQALELAPFTKLLYSSDAFGVPELYHLGAVLFREAVRGVLEGWVSEGRCAPADATRIAGLVGRENALRIYPLARSAFDRN
jgi:predicted TIM-barrel fold metal-dependent hydrolase